ncbi:flagellar brake protein [Ketobacter sp.]|uniref:flagellar brake protein n=1 Tax=Ketobacter sp. TaxID=2083498 RepID=UPI000F265C9C|nr:flagellar brake protein [Ketobacter sp.]RLT92259.1 MAG: hypothetical protein D9N14_22370 [Ketobacter sp.]
MARVAAKLKSWWQQKSNTDPLEQRIERRSVPEEVMHLFRLRREHSLLQARFSGVDDVFQSLLLEVDLEQNRLILDEPFPHRFPTQYWIGRRIKVATSENGLATRFDSRVSGALALEQGNALIVELPRDIMAAQRRSSFRLAVNARMPVDAVVRLPEQGNLAARVLDLSAAGIRLAIPGEFAELGEETRLALRLGGEAPMVSQLAVRHLQTAAEAESCTLLGARLTGLNNSQSKVIERFLVRMQRVQRQRELEAGMA